MVAKSMLEKRRASLAFRIRELIYWNNLVNSVEGELSKHETSAENIRNRKMEEINSIIKNCGSTDKFMVGKRDIEILTDWLRDFIEGSKATLPTFIKTRN